MNLPKFLQETAILSGDLIYISETDAPVSETSAARPADELTAETFKEGFQLAPLTSLDERDYEQFFAGQIGDGDAEWELLKEFLDSQLTDQTVFFTKDINYQVWAVGLFTDEGGNKYIAGIQSNGRAT